MEGEEEYIERLAALNSPLVSSGVGRRDVNDTAMRLAKPQLCVGFHYLEMANFYYWTESVRSESRARVAAKYANLHRCGTQNKTSSARRMIACLTMTVNWTRIEVLMRFYVELPKVFTYNGSTLMDHQSSC